MNIFGLTGGPTKVTPRQRRAVRAMPCSSDKVSNSSPVSASRRGVAAHDLSCAIRTHNACAKDGICRKRRAKAIASGSEPDFFIVWPSRHCAKWP